MVEDTVADSRTATLEMRVKSLEDEAAKREATIEKLVREYKRLGEAQPSQKSA